MGWGLRQNFRSQPLGVDPGLRLRWWGGSLLLFACFLLFLGPRSADWAVLGPVFFSRLFWARPGLNCPCWAFCCYYYYYCSFLSLVGRLRRSRQT